MMNLLVPMVFFEDDRCYPLSDFFLFAFVRQMEAGAVYGI